MRNFGIDYLNYKNDQWYVIVGAYHVLDQWYVVLKWGLLVELLRDRSDNEAVLRSSVWCS